LIRPLFYLRSVAYMVSIPISHTARPVFASSSVSFRLFFTYFSESGGYGNADDAPERRLKEYRRELKEPRKHKSEEKEGDN